MDQEIGGNRFPIDVDFYTILKEKEREIKKKDWLNTDFNGEFNEWIASINKIMKFVE